MSTFVEFESPSSNAKGARDYKERSNTPPRYRSDSPGRDNKGSSRRVDGYRDRSRSASPYYTERGYLGHDPQDKYSKPVFMKSSLRT